MVDKEDLLKQAEDIHSGLKRLSLKNRKVVMPHHKEFELIEELEELSIDLIENIEDANKYENISNKQLSFITQTTLSVDDTKDIIGSS